MLLVNFSKEDTIKSKSRSPEPKKRTHCLGGGAKAGHTTETQTLYFVLFLILSEKKEIKITNNEEFDPGSG